MHSRDLVCGSQTTREKVIVRFARHEADRRRNPLACICVLFPTRPAGWQYWTRNKLFRPYTDAKRPLWDFTCLFIRGFSSSNQNFLHVMNQFAVAWTRRYLQRPPNRLHHAAANLADLSYRNSSSPCRTALLSILARNRARGQRLRFVAPL